MVTWFDCYFAHNLPTDQNSHWGFYDSDKLNIIATFLHHHVAPEYQLRLEGGNYCGYKRVGAKGEARWASPDDLPVLGCL